MKEVAVIAIVVSVLFISCDSIRSQSEIFDNSEGNLEQPTDRNLSSVFRLVDINGETVNLENFKNKKSLILIFWTTWCPYCRRAIQNLNQQYSQLESLDIEVLAINIMEKSSRVKLFLSSFPVQFRVLLDEEGKLAEFYNLIGVPTYILIDKQGEVKFNKNYFPQADYRRLLSEE